jgi:hypothetical protein
LLDAGFKVEAQLVVHFGLDDAAPTQPKVKKRANPRSNLSRHEGACYAVRGSRIATTVRA